MPSQCVSMRRAPMTSPPGSASSTLPKRASRGPSSMIEARTLGASSWAGRQLWAALASSTTVSSAGPFDGDADPGQDLADGQDVADARHALQRHGLVGQKTGEQGRERFVLIPEGRTVPLSGRPPSMTNLCMRVPRARAGWEIWLGSL